MKITLTQANDEGFDPEKFNFDIKNMSNVQVFCVLRVIELINEGHLHYVKLEFCKGDISDPKCDPMIVGTISRFLEQEMQDGSSKSELNHQWRVMWDNKLWRPLDDDAATILECFMGVDADKMKAFSDKLYDVGFRQMLHDKLISETAHKIELHGWKLREED